MAPYVHRWSAAQPRCIVLIAHGYGEHAGRYEHVAQRLVDDLDAAVYAPDHRGHGRTDGATGTVQDGEAITSDLHDVADTARAEHPGLPVALIGHSMGGLIATRFAQRYGDELAALVRLEPGDRRQPRVPRSCWRWTRSPRSRSTRPRCRATRTSARPTPPTSSSTTARSSA